MIGLNVSLDNFTLDAYLRENIYNFKYKILNNAFNISYCPEYEIDIDGIKQNALCFTKHLSWMHVAHILRQNDRKMIQTFPIYSISLFIQNRFIITPCPDR